MSTDIIYEFLYNSDCCESAARTMSLHKTKKGAEMATEFHKNKIKKEHNELYGDKHKADFEWDFNQWWGIRETALIE